ncbi:oxaloacetate decarboxylase [Variovorax sp. LARHSF232]
MTSYTQYVMMNTLRNAMGSESSLRDLLAGPRMVVAPGGYDAISARAIEAGGFPAAYMSGSAVSASCGFPDFGLLTLTEMARAAGVMAQSIRIPLIADADTGFGNEINVTRTVREYERAGVAALHIEDQVSPKRCGHFDGKEVVERDEFVAKIRAALAARQSTEFLIIARTDARAMIGLDEAIARANLALEAGADIAFVEAAQSLEELAEIPRRVRGPCLLNIVRGGKTPDLHLDDAERMGYRLVILPSHLLTTALTQFDEALRSLRETRMPPSSSSGPSVVERSKRFGADEWNSIRTAYRDLPGQSAADAA